MTNNQWDVKVHKYGLGDTTRTILLSEADLKGQGTFGMKDNEADEGKKIPLEIIDASTAFNNVTGGSGDLDLLHVNCEGCEYEMLENIIKSGLHWKIKIIQFGTHFFPEVPRLTERYCAIRSELSKSHQMVYGAAFAWGLLLQSRVGWSPILGGGGCDIATSSAPIRCQDRFWPRWLCAAR